MWIIRIQFFYDYGDDTFNFNDFRDSGMEYLYFNNFHNYDMKLWEFNDFLDSGIE